LTLYIFLLIETEKQKTNFYKIIYLY